MDLGALRLEPLGGAGDEVRGGAVECLDLVEHDLLVGHRHGHRDRDLERADGHVEGAIDAAHELAVVADDERRGEHALLVDRELLLQVHGALAQHEDELLLDELSSRIVRPRVSSSLALMAASSARARATCSVSVRVSSRMFFWSSLSVTLSRLS